MSQFGKLNKLKVTADMTATYTFYQIEGEPMLHVSPATEANKPYFNKLLKSSKKNRRRLEAGNFTIEVIAENRDNDRVLYPQFVVRSWEKVKDDQGKLVELSQENVSAFLNALPNWLFDDFRTFCGDPQSFIKDDEELVDAEDVVENLP